MAKAYYGSRFSDNMTRTPEGFLICHNVPIARTGWQEYLDNEIGVAGASGKRVKVYRSEEEVFDPATIASFEAKSVTDNHPRDTDVTPDNYSSFEKGHVTNVRRGSGEQEDCLLADLVIKDPILISKIDAGKRSISCGYNSIYEPMGDDQYAQKQIRGNHVAVVQEGRAGPRVAIKDEKPKSERSKPMKFTEQLIKALGWKQFVQDASPEELAEAMKSKEEPEKTKDEGGEEIPPWAKAILERLDKLEAGSKPAEEKPAVDALDALEKELGEGGPAGGESEEESKTVPAETMDADPDPAVKKDKPAPTADAALKQAVAVARAIVSGLPESERPAASQRAADALRKDLPKRTEDKPAGYQQLLNRKTADSKEDDPAAFGKNCAKLNPHTKK